MRVSKKMFFFLMIGICIIGINANAGSEPVQICFKLLPPAGLFGEVPVILKLGVMNFGNYHMAISGTATDDKATPGSSNTVRLVHGNAEIANDKVEVALTVSSMSSDGQSTATYFYHLRLDNTTLSGTYILTYPVSTTFVRVGPVSVVPCSGLP